MRDGLPRNKRPLTPSERELVKEAWPFIMRAVRHFDRLRVSSGLGDADDAVSHVAIVFAARLQGDHPYDAARSSLKNYCFMLTRSVLLNQGGRAKNRDRVVEAIEVATHVPKGLARDRFGEC